MPIYEYKCHRCSKEFEFLSTRNDPVVLCPLCHSNDIEKIMSLTHFRYADHFVKDMTKGLAKSREFDQMQAELKKTMSNAAA